MRHFARLAAFLAVAVPAAAQDAPFTTAAQVRPILDATRGSWVALREYGGQDLVYVTQVMSWRCGLMGLRVGINGGEPQDWPMPDCDPTNPNVIPDDAVIYQGFPVGSIRSLEVELIYDDLTQDSETFARAAVLMP
ncbi:hypothetical protein [Pseudooceanicola sp. LIPI14-2-Ac024]|uniref:hypothetical protein n=1 Tax=Pseudooceanicola sp. LIPI14-2-Ac024 TaxID=3344875 RepID=UPI0035CFAC8F